MPFENATGQSENRGFCVGLAAILGNLWVSWNPASNPACLQAKPAAQAAQPATAKDQPRSHVGFVFVTTENQFSVCPTTVYVHPQDNFTLISCQYEFSLHFANCSEYFTEVPTPISPGYKSHSFQVREQIQFPDKKPIRCKYSVAMPPKSTHKIKPSDPEIIIEPPTG